MMSLYIPPRVCYNMYMKDKKMKLIHHISRLEGQLASVKKELALENTNCEKAALTLKAASRSFSSLRMSFVTCFLETKYVSATQKKDSAYLSLLQVINS
jgi:DNA-binding FrmR family transcriptional regulator